MGNKCTGIYKKRGETQKEYMHRYHKEYNKLPRIVGNRQRYWIKKGRFKRYKNSEEYEILCDCCKEKLKQLFKKNSAIELEQNGLN